MNNHHSNQSSYAYDKKFIVIEGPIGAGKTTLAKKVAQSLNYDTLLEKAEDNPFLERFYANKSNAALATQIFFLLQRAQQISGLKQDDMFSPCQVADFLIDKDKLFAQVTLDAEELSLYQQLYNHITIDAPKPDLVIYLQAPPNILLERIKKRGIAAEQTIDTHYLQSLNAVYTKFFHFYDQAPLLIVNTQSIDWVNNDDDYHALLAYMLKINTGRHYYNPQPTLPA